MDDRAHEHGTTEETPGEAPERTCAVTRAKLEPEALIRFVRGPDGSIVPDLAGRLPGRGVWVTCARNLVEEAARRNAFARSLKRPVTVPGDLAAIVEDLLRRRAMEALSFANKAGLVTAGFTRAESAIRRGEAVVVVHAADAADDGRRKLDGKFKAVLAEIAPGTEPDIVTDLTAAELSLAIGRLNVVHAALATGGAARNFLKEAGRLRRYRTNSSGQAAAQPQTRSDTEQA